MPRRDDIRHVLVIGSGPIVIGQACEFDYSGSQACRVLRQEGMRVSLVNSNPATIMTDPEMADATYVEPITPEVLERVIEKERPDALLATLGGQTALNCAVALHERGVLDKYSVELIGADIEAIGRGEDRQRFKEIVASVGADVPRSEACRSMAEVRSAAARLGLPVVIRPSFTMGGQGSGIATSAAELDRLASGGLASSPVGEVLVEESVISWKEYELELMRDHHDNVVVVCSIENVDPMGVHTGDSVTVAPALTLTDREYQHMRDVGIAVLRAVGVATGGCNIQFAVNPRTGALVVIEINPRVSRSSALASKATGFPIAKIAAKLAVGYTLDEIANDITGRTPACFEPALDYVVVKVPRFDFEKFPEADRTLTTTMKSVGEAMAIGRSFPEALGKALRSTDTAAAGFWTVADPAGATVESALAELRTPHDGRIYTVERALRLGATVAQVHDASGIDPWFVDQILAVVQLREKVAAAPELEARILREAKRAGLSDQQIAVLRPELASEEAVRSRRHGFGVRPVFKTVDTCAAEFDATTPYYYSAYELDAEAESEVAPQSEPRDKVLIIGSGPNRIGQAIEFDYCCVHAAMTLRGAGFESVMINCNPETVSTDYDTSDRLYFEPLTLEDILEVYEAEFQSGPVAGVIVQLGGQAPLRLAHCLEQADLPMIGTSPEAIHLAEDRIAFARVLAELGLSTPAHGSASSFDRAHAVAERIGYPVVVRPSYVLGGRGMAIVHDAEDLDTFMKRATTDGTTVLVDKLIENAIEIDVDALYDGHEIYLGGVMEHIEEAGVHSGDSACVIPPITLDGDDVAAVRAAAEAIAARIGVRGLLNVQYALAGGTLYVLEANPRASRTMPYVSKVTNVALAKAGTRIMLGATIAELRAEGLLQADGDGSGPLPGGLIAVKEAVLPFHRFRTTAGEAIGNALGPEMRSTGEVIGVADTFGEAFAKAQLAAGHPVPTSGRVYVATAPACLPRLGPQLRTLAGLGFEIGADQEIIHPLARHGVSARSVTVASALAWIRDHEVSLVISPAANRADPLAARVTRAAAAWHGVSHATTVNGVLALVRAIKATRRGSLAVCSLQEMHGRARPRVPRHLAAGHPQGSALIADHVYDLILDDVFLRVAGVGQLTRFFLKIEAFNAGGSIKMKTAYGLIESAENSGADMSRIHLIESSSGNLGVALAVICATKGYTLTCVADPNSNPASIAIMRALGTQVVIVRDRDANGGFLGSRIGYIRRRLAAETDLYWLNQYSNLSNPAAHERFTAPAVHRAFGTVDYLFLGAGTGGTLMGCSDYFRRRSPGTKIVAVDAAGSVSFGLPPAARHIPGVGTSQRPEILDPHVPDQVVVVPEEETVRECRWLSRGLGLLAGGSTGTVVAAVRRLAGSIPASATVVAIAPDHGERYLGSVYDDDWVIKHGLERAIDPDERREQEDVLV